MTCQKCGKDPCATPTVCFPVPPTTTGATEAKAAFEKLTESITTLNKTTSDLISEVKNKLIEKGGPDGEPTGTEQGTGKGGTGGKKKAAPGLLTRFNRWFFGEDEEREETK